MTSDQPGHPHRPGSPGTASRAIPKIPVPGEEWRPVPGWEDRYEVSNLGRVYRIKQPGFPRSGRILRPHVLPTGYETVNLWRDRQKTAITVHRLVAWAFIGPQPKGIEVRHLDGNSLNNRLGNLRYGTPSENIRDSLRHGTHAQAAKTHCPYGHPYDLVNTYIQPSSGGRKCRVCKLKRGREYEARKRIRRSAA